MQLLQSPGTLSGWSDAQRVAGRRVALVPTMGALHKGHVALIEEARRQADVVAVSIFVNPLQFDVRDDFQAYPHALDSDLEICTAAGVDVVYAPTAAAMYPVGFETHVDPGPTGEVLEGAHRPGHFRGVTTVVAKLFGAARPHVAIFGEKDFQQLVIIQRMVADFDMGVQIVGLPTVREPDGLAMSSRNRRLSTAERVAATSVPRSLQAVADAVAGGERDSDTLEAIGREVVDREPMARFEHLQIVHPSTLQPLETLTDEAVAVTAVWFGDVRLIDNRRLTTDA